MWGGGGGGQRCVAECVPRASHTLRTRLFEVNAVGLGPGPRGLSSGRFGYFSGPITSEDVRRAGAVEVRPLRWASAGQTKDMS